MGLHDGSLARSAWLWSLDILEGLQTSVMTAERSNKIAQAFRPGNQQPRKCALQGRQNRIISKGVGINALGCPYGADLISYLTQA